MSEKIQDIPEEVRMSILTSEQNAISGLNPEDLAKRVGDLEVLIREARLRLQVNVSKRAAILSDMEAEEKLIWRERSKKYKTDLAPDDDGEKTPRAPRKSASDKAIASFMAALGMTQEEAEAHVLSLKS